MSVWTSGLGLGWLGVCMTDKDRARESASLQVQVKSSREGSVFFWSRVVEPSLWGDCGSVGWLFRARLFEMLGEVDLMVGWDGNGIMGTVERGTRDSFNLGE